MRSRILEIVMESVGTLNALLDIDKKVIIEQGEDAQLYGAAGTLDSLSLVSLIVSTEQDIEDEFGVSLTLASEKAMSQRKSPFSTVGALVNYIETLIQQESIYA